MRVNDHEEVNTVEKTVGTIVSVTRQWWAKINRKPVRLHPLDGATFPHVLKIRYTVAGKDYTRKKWVHVGSAVPDVGSAVEVFYWKSKPSKAKIEI